MAYQNKWGFVPKTDAEFEKIVADWKAVKPNVKHIQAAPNCLEQVGDGDALYIFGHGNLGQGIGPSKDEAIPANDLAILLKDHYKLPDQQITIKLLACNTGVVMPTLDQSYAFAFALAMSALHYTNILVDGYVGFVDAKSSPKTSHLQIVPFDSDDESLGGMPADAPGAIKPKGGSGELRRVRFSLAGGSVSKIAGDDWIGTKVNAGYVDPSAMRYEINKA